MNIRSTGLIKGGSPWLASAFMLLSSQSLLAAPAPASYITALTVNGDVISFTTDSAKTHTLPACVSSTSEAQWAISYTGNAPLYALLSIAQSANEPIEITSANDCGAASGIERASNVNIHYQWSEQTPAVVASNTNFVARSTLEVPDGVEPGSVVVQFQLTGPGSSATWQTASVVDNAYTFNFGQLAQGSYTLVTKAGSGETEVQDSINFSALTMNTSPVYVDNATGNLYLQLPDGTYLELTQADGSWTVAELSAAQWNALAPAINFAVSDHQLNWGDFAGDTAEDFKLVSADGSGDIIFEQTAGGYQASVPVDVDVPLLPTLASDPGIALASEKIGTIAANVDVDNSGGASWRSELLLPKGKGGIQPDISLSYSSNAGNGVLGVGWSVNVGSGISRCRRYFELDGQFQAVQFTTEDALCLDGQRLVLASGNNLANGAQYRAQLDPTTKVVFYSAGSGYFAVTRPDGITLTYGHTADSVTKDVASGTTYSWMLNRKQDNYSNIIDYRYTGGNANKSQLDQLTYSGNTVAFTYVTRADSSQYFYQGNAIVDDKLLSDITISNHDGVSVNSYHFSHHLSSTSGRNLLDKITRCDGTKTGTCLPPTTFDYEDNIAVGLVDSTAEIVISIDDFLPVSGDKASDYCDQYFQFPDKYCLSKDLDIIDADGDGIPELLITNGVGSTYEYQSLNINQTGYTLGNINGSGALFERNVKVGDKMYYTVHSVSADVIDQNGDGIDEIMWSAAYQERSFLSFFYADLNGDGLVESANFPSRAARDIVDLNYVFPGDMGQEQCESQMDFDYSSEETLINVFDFNGDGLVDRLMQVEGSCKELDDEPFTLGFAYVVMKNTSSGSTYSQESYTEEPFFLSDEAFFINESTHQRKTFSGDINGDGYLDFSQFGCTTGVGVASGCLADHHLPGFMNTNQQYVDINYDGRDDHVTTAGATLSAFGAGAAQTLTFAGQLSVTDMPKDAKLLWVDLDGDGAPALVYFDIGTQKIHILHDANTANTAVDSLLSVDNGLGLSSSFDYASLTHDDVYDRYTDANTLDWGNSPVFDAKGGGYVVASLTRDTGSDAAGLTLTTTMEYAYEGRRHQSGGQGGLGFAKIVETNLATRQRTLSEYRQESPFTGQLKKQTVQVQDLSGVYQTLSEMTVTQWYHQTYLNGLVHHVLPQISQQKSFAIDGSAGDVAATTTALNTKVTSQSWSPASVGNYGTMSNTTVVTTDHISNDVLNVTTAFTYDDDLDDWLVQRPGTITTTHTMTYSDGTTDVKTQLQTMGYNTKGNVDYKDIGSNSNGAEYLRSAYGYDAAGNITSVTQCSSHYATDCATRSLPADTDTDMYKVFRRNLINYDSANRYISSTGNGLFTTSSFSSYNPLGLPGKITDVHGVSQYLYYDSFGRQYFSASDDGSSVKTLLGDCNDGDCADNARYYVSTSSPQAPDSIVYFDITDREVAKRTQTLSGKWSQISQVFDANGRLTEQSKPHFTTSDTVYAASLFYDDLGRKYQELAADGTVKTISYASTKVSTSVNSTYISATGEAVSSANITQASSKTFNGFGQMIISTDANDQETLYQYGALGKLIQASNIDGSAIIVDYDNYGRKTRLNDPDKGLIDYDSNGLGQLVRRTAPGNMVQTSYFDAIGRKVKVQTTASEGNHSGEFNYVGAYLDSEVSSEGLSRQFGYDTLGRLNSVTHQVDNETSLTWQTRSTFDQYGRVFQQFDMSGQSRGVQYSYQNGYANSLHEAQNSALVYYQANTMDAFANVTSWTLGNGHTGSASYDAKTGFIQSRFAGDGGVAIQDHLYEYDGLGNLRARTDLSGDLLQTSLQEIFSYDDLNRLTKVTFNSIGSLDLTYFDNGNIATKSDVASGSTYGYGVKKSQCSVTPGDHALTGIGSSISYCYDARGNQTATYQNGSKTREVGYTGYDKPASIWSANGLTEFNYDAGHQRFKRRDSGDSDDRTTYYIGGHEVVKHDNGLAEFKRYIGDMVIDIVRSNGTQDTHYLYRDHLGSLVAIADDQGAFIERLSYDAFGKRREGISWNALQSAFTLPSLKAALAITERGFTGHEHIDHANIIHMGGRIYDPGVGRFVQADPLVQAPQNGQSLNRYSYVFNNPLSYTDPTGYKTTCNIRDIRGGNEVCMNQGNGRDERYSKSGDKGRGSARQQAKASKAVQSASKGVSNGAFKNNGGGGDKTQQPGRRGDGDGGEQRDGLMKKASSVLSNADLVKRGLEMTDTDIHLNSKTTKGLVISGGPPTIVTKTKISLTAKPLQGKNVTSISWLGVLGKVLKAGGMVTGVASGLTGNSDPESFGKFLAGASSPVAGGILAADGVVGLFYPGGAVSVVNDVSNGIEDAANRQLQSEGIHTDAQFIDSFLGDDYD